MVLWNSPLKRKAVETAAGVRQKFYGLKFWTDLVYHTEDTKSNAAGTNPSIRGCELGIRVQLAIKHSLIYVVMQDQVLGLG